MKKPKSSANLQRKKFIKQKQRKYGSISPEFYQWLNEMTQKNKDLLKELAKV